MRKFIFNLIFLGIFLTSITTIENLSSFAKRDFDNKETQSKINGMYSQPISIDNDTDFLIQASQRGWSGNGSVDSPIIIRDLNIQATGLINHAISIMNTNSNFIIHNCTLKISGASSYPFRAYNSNNGLINDSTLLGRLAGIFLEKVTNFTLTHNIASGNEEGIFIQSSSNNTIHSNTLFLNDQGIYLSNSNRNSITFNVVRNNNQDGIDLRLSDYNNVTNNTIYDNKYYGVRIRESYFAWVVNNTIYNNEDGAIRYFESFNITVISNVYSGPIPLMDVSESIRLTSENQLEPTIYSTNSSHSFPLNPDDNVEKPSSSIDQSVTIISIFSMLGILTIFNIKPNLSFTKKNKVTYIDLFCPKCKFSLSITDLVCPSCKSEI